MKRPFLALCALLAAAALTACSAQPPVQPESAAPESAVTAEQMSTLKRRANTETATAESAKKKAPAALTVHAGGKTVYMTPSENIPAIQISAPEDLPTIEGSAGVVVTLDGKVVYSGDADGLSGFIPPRNGEYFYTATPSGQKESCQFRADLRLPVQITLAQRSIVQGEVMQLHARYADGLTLTAKSDLGFSPRFFADGDQLTALLPVRYTTTPGSYTVDVSSGSEPFHAAFTVEEREFEIQRLTISSSTASETALSAKANAEWEQKVEPLKAVADPERHWEGKFLQPVKAEITTEFGCIRYTNNDPNPSRHGGIDIAADRGEPVLATNNGRVLFAEKIQLTGNTVVIEHGYGLKSFYYHMDGLNIQTGDTVEKGQQIGIVGSTGYSTGPHLHFAMAVNNVFINPWTAFSNGF